MPNDCEAPMNPVTSRKNVVGVSNGKVMALNFYQTPAPSSSAAS